MLTEYLRDRKIKSNSILNGNYDSQIYMAVQVPQGLDVAAPSACQRRTQAIAIRQDERYN